MDRELITIEVHPAVQQLADEHFGGNVLSVYTREDAIADGFIVDVSKLASEYGFRVPVGFSRAVWELVSVDKDCPRCTEETRAACQRCKGAGTVKKRAGIIEDTTGRTWDVLTMLRHAAKRTEGDRLTFRVLLSKRYVDLKSKIDGDGILVMLPDES